MEPDMEKIIAYKIRAVERNPVCWNKRDVWERIGPEITSTPPNYIPWYSAAAAIVFLLLFPCSSVLHQVDKVVIAQRPEVSPRPQPGVTYAGEVVENVQPQEVTSSAKAMKSRSRTMSKPLGHGEEVDLPELEEVEAIPFESVAITLPAIDAIEPSPSAEKIRPIVGVIDDAVPGGVVETKRSRMYKLQPATAPDSEEIKNALVLARRK